MNGLLHLCLRVGQNQHVIREGQQVASVDHLSQFLGGAQCLFQVDVEQHRRQHTSLDHSQVGLEGVLPDDHLGLLVHLDYEHSQCPVGLVQEPAAQDPPELLPVDRVVGLLQVNEDRVLSPFLSLSRVDLSHQPADVCRGGGALLETGLVDPGLQ